MSPRSVLRGLMALTVAVAFWPLGRTVADASDEDKPALKRATAEELGGRERYLTHLSTDKPIYREGETVRVRGVILHANTRQPLAQTAHRGHALVEIKGPKGNTVASGNAVVQDSVLGFGWQIPAATAGGEYTIRVQHPHAGYPPAERRIDVRAYRPPRLKSQIVFLRDGYGPGDEVTATLHSERAEGGIPTGAKVTATARVDGKEVFRGQTRLDAQGNCRVSFVLPKPIERGDGTLAFAIEDGGVVETESKTIPILLQTLDLAMYPEGGELVAGLPCRVYLEGRTPAKKPADLEGVVVDHRGRQVARVKTEHDGRGRFQLTPKKGASYALKVSKPSGISKTFPLPEVKEGGVVLTAVGDVVPAGQPVRLRVGATRPGKLTLTVSRREEDVAWKTLEVRKARFWRGGAVTGKLLEHRFDLPPTVDGVLIATVWGESGEPLAERLIFREPARTLQVRVDADKKRYVPGGQVELQVQTLDGEGQPIAATVGVTVTDESVLEMVDKREQAPRLPVMALLEDEVRELADAHVYLDPSNPKAPLAVDLLLGTQGWRRFALMSVSDFVTRHEDAARRAVALVVARPRPVRRLRRPRPSRQKRAMRLAERHDDVPMAAEEPSMMAAPPMAAPPVAAPPMAAPQRAPRAQKPSRPRARAPRPMARPRPAPPGVVQKSQPAPSAARLGVARAVAGAEHRMKKRALVADAPVRAGMVYVRVYAHPHRPQRRRHERTDFTETVYWAAALRTDDSGKATVRFALSDSVTAFRVAADAFDAQGALGTGTRAIESVRPFYAEPKLPLQVTQGDVISLPVAAVNATEETLQDGTLTVTASGILPDSPSGAIKLNSLTLAPDTRERRLVRLDVGRFVGRSNVVIAAEAGPFRDTVDRELDVQPLGFPQQQAAGGTLEPGKTVTFSVSVPQSLVSGSLQSTVKIMPTPLASMTQALERLIREPHGCFEQTSSTNYPLVMAQQYFTTHSGVPASLIERSREKLTKGYRRLVGFECRQTGYEWFGKDPAHEALTAYGLMQFTDMAKIFPVDMKMVERTRARVLKARDGKGGFKHERRALHTWLVEPELHNGYITWALMESGERSIDREVSSFEAAALQSRNSYAKALGANVAALAAHGRTSKKLMEALVAKQADDGSVAGATTSIVGSRGQALLIETTALATLAWLREPAYAAAAANAVRFLADSCKGGRYGSTQSTVLALRAIIEYDRINAKPKSAGRVGIRVDGKALGEVPLDPAAQSAIVLPDISKHLRAGGRHQIAIEMKGGSSMPFSSAVSFNAQQPESSKECHVGLQTTLRDRTVQEGAVTEIDVTVRNLAKKAIPTTVAIVGVPGGLKVRHDQLKELRKAGRIAAYEVIGRDVVLYWRELAAEQVVELPISLVAEVPGTYTGPASRAYEYYADEYKRWGPGLKVQILPRGG